MEVAEDKVGASARVAGGEVVCDAAARGRVDVREEPGDVEARVARADDVVRERVADDAERVGAVLRGNRARLAEKARARLAEDRRVRAAARRVPARGCRAGGGDESGPGGSEARAARARRTASTPRVPGAGPRRCGPQTSSPAIARSGSPAAPARRAAAASDAVGGAS